MSMLLIGKDWQARALLRAQLLEEGVQVKAAESVADALDGVVNHPRLIFADLSDSDDVFLELDQLTQWAKFIPTWILVRPSSTPEYSVQGRGVLPVAVKVCATQ
jgi:CheY-like chemotaxis protein